MRLLSPAGQQAVNDLAQRHGFSSAAVLCMLEAVIQGNGSMAQFSHPEFGGSGQWMQGGMTMVSDLFNHALAEWHALDDKRGWISHATDNVDRPLLAIETAA